MKQIDSTLPTAAWRVSRIHARRNGYQAAKYERGAAGGWKPAGTVPQVHATSEEAGELVAFLNWSLGWEPGHQAQTARGAVMFPILTEIR